MRRYHESLVDQMAQKPQPSKDRSEYTLLFILGLLLAVMVATCFIHH